jgi:hypothetical protein
MIVLPGSRGLRGAVTLIVSAATLQSSSFHSFNRSFGRNAPAHLTIGALKAAP